MKKNLTLAIVGFSITTCHAFKLDDKALGEFSPDAHHPHQITLWVKPKPIEPGSQTVHNRCIFNATDDNVQTHWDTYDLGQLPHPDQTIIRPLSKISPPFKFDAHRLWSIDQKNTSLCGISYSFTNTSFYIPKGHLFKLMPDGKSSNPSGFMEMEIIPIDPDKRIIIDGKIDTTKESLIDKELTLYNAGLILKFAHPKSAPKK